MTLTPNTKKLIAVVITISLITIGSLAYYQFFYKKENNALQITSMELIHAEETNFTVTVAIKNTGKNNIENAQLKYIFLKDNDIIDQTTQIIGLETNREETYHTSFINIPFDSNSTYKAIATIYLGETFLDTKTITRQF